MNLIKLTVPSNKDFLKANKQHLYNKPGCIKKYRYYQFSSEYQVYSSN
jgi:hypothetical protein